MLSRLVPAPLVRWFARPYVAGDSVEEALRVARELQDGRGIRTTLDLLGEGVTRAEQVQSNVRVYERLIDAVAAEEGLRDASISLKPSAFTTGDPEAVRAPLTALAERAHARGVPLTIDMEERRWTDLTLDVAIGIFERGFDVGTVLQTRLFRTAQDVERIPAGMRLRLVIGIYPEAEEVALIHKREMKEVMITQAKRLLERGAFVEFATHDVEFVERFSREVAPAAPERCEVQMLLGVPRTPCHRSLLDGSWGIRLPVRLYVPFAIGWDDATAYLRRRMEESPSMVWLVLRNFLHAGRDR
jgi:proline dehydrogenase